MQAAPSMSDRRRASTSPTTTASLTSGLPLRHPPEGITPSNLTSGPSGFSSMRFSAGVTRPIQVLGAQCCRLRAGREGAVTWTRPLHHSLGA